MTYFDNFPSKGNLGAISRQPGAEALIFELTAINWDPAEDTFAGDPELENLEAEFEARFASQHGIFKELEKQSGDLDAIGVELLTIRRPSDTKGAPPRTDQETRSSTSSDTTIPPVGNRKRFHSRHTRAHSSMCSWRKETDFFAVICLAFWEVVNLFQSFPDCRGNFNLKVGILAEFWKLVLILVQWYVG